MTTSPDPLSPSLASAVASWCQTRYQAENEPVPYSLTPQGEAALAGPPLGGYPDLNDPERLAEWCGFASASDMCAAYEAYADDLEARADAEPEAGI